MVFSVQEQFRGIATAGDCVGAADAVSIGGTGVTVLWPYSTLLYYDRTSSTYIVVHSILLYIVYYGRTMTP